jgi:formate hydrogenlyase subunit 3/multisubunit Na+/H+ antiporter MnhD subunit
MMGGDLWGDGWPALLVLVPVLAAAAAFVAPRAAASVGISVSAGLAVAGLALAARITALGPVTVPLGGWGAPLGIDLGIDGLAALLVAMTCCIGLLVGIAAANDRRQSPPAIFWPLWMVLLAGLNAIYLSDDVFNIYVALEVIGLAAVGLTAMTGRAAALRAALTYLFAGLVGSLLFLLGVHFLYAAHGRVDIGGLADATGGAATTAALMLMLGGLALKTAIFPLHFWLPAAHSSAAPPASALLSALVVKGSLYVALRLWLELFSPSDALALLMGLLGAGAVLYGSWQALRAKRLKLLVAYSTVAQIGMMTIAFALTNDQGAEAALRGAVFLMLAHAVAKAAMFLAAGRIAHHIGHDRIDGIDRAAIRPGAAQVAFALAAISLIGLPPSAGFVGKWLLLEGAIVSDAWVWALVIMAGTALSAAYLLRVLAAFVRFDRIEGPLVRPDWTAADAAPLALALASMGLGLAAAWPLALMLEGHPLVPEIAP